MKSFANFHEFTADAMDDGFEEIIQREWAPHLTLEKHTHCFDARVQVATGPVSYTHLRAHETN
jgi:hypothetical protein